MLSKLFVVLATGSTDEFKKARLKLTFWYVCIIACILMVFSTIVYFVIKERYVHMAVKSFTLTQEQAKVKALNLNQGDVGSIKEETKNGLREISVEFENGESIDFSPLYPEWKFDSAKTIEEDFIEGVEESLILINLIILLISTILAYILAGKTLSTIRDKMKREEMFIQDAAHELRNPLSCIKLTCQSELKKWDSPVWQEVLEEANRLIALSEWLLTLSRKNSGKKEELKLREVIKQVIKSLTPLTEEKNITPNFNLSDFRVFGNKTALEKVLFNLLHNAIKFSPRNGKIHVMFEKSGILTVQDSGGGISKNDISHIFERFYKADNSRDFQNGGSGLWLSIVKDILDSMGASISVES